MIQVFLLIQVFFKFLETRFFVHEIGTMKIDALKVGTLKVGTMKIDTLKIDILRVDTVDTEQDFGTILSGKQFLYCLKLLLLC